MTSPSGIIYEFADFRLIPSEGLLLQHGVPVSLSIKAFSTLVLLVERHGHLISKAELIETVWSDTFVEEAAVSRCVWTIRNALGEDAKSGSFIQTIPRRGYRFVAPVDVLNDRSDNGTDEPELISTGFRIPADPVVDGNGTSTAELDAKFAEYQKNDPIIDGSPTSASRETYKPVPKRGLRRQPYLFGLAAVVLLAAAVFAAYVSFPSAPNLSGDGPITLAVLPFQPINAADRDELYYVGITDALINRFSTMENFQVRPLGSIRRYVDLETDALEAGVEQKVAYVLASRYQLLGGKIRITAQLVNVKSGKTIETYDFQKDAPDAFTAQDAIVLELEDRLAAKFGTREVLTNPDRGTHNEEAYRYYLLAQNFNELRGPENGRLALEQIDRAIALDPNFARAWATKAYIHRYMGYGPAAIEHSTKSMEAVEKALALEPDLSEAHSILCFNKFRFEYDVEAAEKACRRAIDLAPESPLAHKLYGNLLYTRGRFEEAISEIKKAIDLQPVSFDNQQTYALALYFARRHPASQAQWKQLIPLNPEHGLIYAHLIKTLVQQGREPEALEQMIKLLTLEKADEETIKRFRAAFAGSGWKGVALERIKLIESRKNQPAFELARLYATIGDRDNAFKYLDRAYRERSNMIAVLEVDPELDPIRGDPRYERLVKSIWPVR